MGAMAEAFVAYAQPLIDATDGSEEQMSKALAMGQLCYNLGLLPEDGQAQMLNQMKDTFQMDEEEFKNFLCTIIGPMLQRHQEMFPPWRAGISRNTELDEPASRGYSGKRASGEAYPGTRPYAPCPCDSGKKYKFCCRMKS